MFQICQDFLVLPCKVAGTSCGLVSTTRGCPHARGSWQNAWELLLSTITTRGLRKNGYKSPGYKLKQRKFDLKLSSG